MVCDHQTLEGDRNEERKDSLATVLRAWNKNFFTSLASYWGKLLLIDSRTRNWDFLEFARLKVQATLPVMINEIALIKVDDVTFYVTVPKENTSRGHPWCQNLRKENHELSSLSVTRFADSIINIAEARAQGMLLAKQRKEKGLAMTGASMVRRQNNTTAYLGKTNVEFLEANNRPKPQVSSAPLQVGFYKPTCPSAEVIVRKGVYKALYQNPGLGAGLIRLHFHDCFVRGCDASVLIDSTPGNPSEKESITNANSLRGFEVIDAVKAEIEAVCPETVSCADVVAFAARDSAYMLGGINYADNFARKGLSLDDMVTLSGAHSIGRAHCAAFSNRLYSFNATNPQDPSLDPAFATILKTKCPSPTNNPNPTVPLDFTTPYRLDNKYYQNLQYSRGLLTSDESLMTSASTVATVSNFAGQGEVWADKFAGAMVRMGLIDVLTGSDGEIRKNCRVIN
ncbi:hypothetical protein Ancab_000569 [Ancistrocladus abbreviatus]